MKLSDGKILEKNLTPRRGAYDAANLEFKNEILELKSCDSSKLAVHDIAIAFEACHERSFSSGAFVGSEVSQYMSYSYDRTLHSWENESTLIRRPKDIAGVS